MAGDGLIIKERLEDEDGHRGLIKDATELMMRLQAISNRGSLERSRLGSTSND